jgi:hypothetical protein
MSSNLSEISTVVNEEKNVYTEKNIRPGLHPNQKVLLYNGEVKMAKEIKVGDLLMGDDGTEREVFSLFSGEDEMYKIIPSEGRSYIVNSQHILTLCTVGRTVEKFEEYWKVSYPENGVIKSKILSPEDGEKFILNIPEEEIFDIPINDYMKFLESSKYFTFHTTVDFKEKTMRKENLYDVGTNIESYRHYFPIEYLTSSRENRLKLMAGIFEPKFILNHLHYSGEFHEREYIRESINNHEKSLKLNSDSLEFITYNNCTAEVVEFLCLSLGFSVDFKKIEARGYQKAYYFIKVTEGNFNSIPFSHKNRPNLKSTDRKIIKKPFVILPLGKGEYNRFKFVKDAKINKNNRFLLGDFKVIHN